MSETTTTETTTSPGVVAVRRMAERADEARDELRTLFPRGSRVPLYIDHVSASGMSRDIVVLASIGTGTNPAGQVRNVSHLVREVGIGTRPRRLARAVTVRGAGMDMAFKLVYTLAADLYGDGYALTYENVG